MKQTVNKIFSKEVQNELKARYEVGLQEVYKKDSDMISWCLKQVVLFVPICGGKYIVTLDKPSIQSEFWFGESDCGQGPSHEENVKQMNSVRFMIEDYFMEANLSGIDRRIEALKESLKEHTGKTVRHFVHYWKCSPDSPLHDFRIYNYYETQYEKDSMVMDKEDIELLIEAYDIFRAKFQKRLETYLKRFSNKLYVHSYWMDR